MRLFIALLFSFAAHAATKNLVVLGDSLTEGYGVARDAAYPALLGEKIKAAHLDWKVINSGISGSTTASAPSRMRWIFKAKPDLIILALGGNDGLRGLKISETTKNLEAAIEYAQERKVPVVLAGLYMPPNYGQKYTRDFHRMYVELARAHHLAFIPFLLEGVAAKPELNQPDGIHPNEKGHAVVAETVFRAIRKEL